MRAFPHLQRARKHARSGTAAMELALVMPVLVPMILGITDLSFAYEDQLQLTAVINAGAQYAFKQGQNATMESGTLVTNVTALVTGAMANASLPGAQVTVTLNDGLDATTMKMGSPTCYCLNVWAASATCGSICADNSTAGVWLTITASFTYTPILSFAAMVIPNPLSQSVTVRLD